MSLVIGFDLCRAALAVTGITAPEQSVLMVLAIMANDQAQCWPGINGPSGLTGKTKLSERTVQRAVQALKEGGHIEWQDRPGRGRVYLVHPRHTGAPVTETPRQADTPVSVTPTPVTVAPKQPRTTTSTIASQSPRKRERSAAQPFHRLPAGWTPTRPLPATLAAKVAEWPPGKLADELTALHGWAVNAEDKNGKGRKIDWDQAWENWLRRADNDWRTRGQRNGQRTHHRRSSNGLLDACIDAEREERAGTGL